MTSRNFSSLLLFESLFEEIPNGNPDFQNLANTIITPNLPVVEHHCKSTLGKFEIVNFESEGLVELATGEILTRERIEDLLSKGIYEIATRHISTCISPGGVCVECYKATYPDRPIPKVMDRVTILPQFLINAEVISLAEGIKYYPVNSHSDMTVKHYLFTEGKLLIEGEDYVLSDGLITLTEPADKDKTAVLRTLRQDASAYIAWLARTYSGSLFGMNPLPSQPLPVRSLLLSSLLSENRLQLISEYIKQMDTVPVDYANYTDQIRDPLEKALYMLALYCIYSNVTL